MIFVIGSTSVGWIKLLYDRPFCINEFFHRRWTLFIFLFPIPVTCLHVICLYTFHRHILCVLLCFHSKFYEWLCFRFLWNCWTNEPLISTLSLPWSWYPNNFYSNVGITRRHVRCFFNAICFTGFWKIRGWPVWWRSHDGSIVDSYTFKLGRCYCDLWWHFSLHMNLPK